MNSKMKEMPSLKIIKSNLRFIRDNHIFTKKNFTVTGKLKKIVSSSEQMLDHQEV